MCTLVVLSPALAIGVLVLFKLVRIAPFAPDEQRTSAGAPAQLGAVSGPRDGPSLPTLEYASPQTSSPPRRWGVPLAWVGTAIGAATWPLMLVATIAGRRHLGHWPGDIPVHSFLPPFPHWAYHHAYFGIATIAVLQIPLLAGGVGFLAAADPDRKTGWSIVIFWSACVVCATTDAWTLYTAWAFA